MSGSASQPAVAMFGLGLMGSGMARRILEAGFPLTVYNRTPEKAAAVVAAGAKLAGSPRDAATGARFVVSMVADDTVSREMWLGENGALAVAAPGSILIESSTLTQGWITELAAAASQRGCELLDAPVTGSKSHAASGQLTFLVGGSAAALETARPVLAAMGQTIVHVGPTGSGALLKLVNNFLCGVQAASFAEGLVLLERGGIDIGAALAVLSNGAPGSPLIKAVSARMAARDYTPNFFLSLMAKDLSYALQEASRRDLDLLTASAAAERFANAKAAGHGMQDYAAVVEPLRDNPRSS